MAFRPPIEGYDPSDTSVDTGGVAVVTAPVRAATTVEIGAVKKMPHIDPASATFNAELVAALIAAGLMESA